MLAGPDSPIDTMIHAVAESGHALDAASELDLDRTDEDRKFFAARKALLAPLLPQLVSAKRAIEDHDLGQGSRLQARVEIGDSVLDRGVRDGNARTKLGLKSKPGLDSTHVFGKNVQALVREKIALEPAKVLDAVSRMEDVADFDGKDTIAQDLTKRAQQQQACLDDREKGAAARAKLVSTAVRLVAEAADAIAALKGALDERFPRQREYVAAFFLDVALARSPAGRPPVAAPPPDLQPSPVP
jgi:hypothetical protein